MSLPCCCLFGCYCCFFIGGGGGCGCALKYSCIIFVFYEPRKWREGRERRCEHRGEAQRERERDVLKSEGLMIHDDCRHVCLGTYVLIPVT